MCIRITSTVWTCNANGSSTCIIYSASSLRLLSLYRVESIVCKIFPVHTRGQNTSRPRCKALLGKPGGCTVLHLSVAHGMPLVLHSTVQQFLVPCLLIISMVCNAYMGFSVLHPLDSRPSSLSAAVWPMGACCTALAPQMHLQHRYYSKCTFSKPLKHAKSATF